MIRVLVLAVGGTAIVVAGLTGCSSTKKSESTASSTAGAGATSVQAGGADTSYGAGTAKVTIDGRPKELQGQVVCSAMGGNLNIAIGQQGTGVAVVMAEDASKVSSVGLGNVDGVVLGYQEMTGGANASATKDGKTYKVTGTASGVDMANPMQPVTKPFEIEVTCP